MFRLITAGLSQHSMLNFQKVSGRSADKLPFGHCQVRDSVNVRAAWLTSLPHSAGLLICGVVTYVGMLQGIGTVDYVGSSVAAIGITAAPHYPRCGLPPSNGHW
ncbi:hypothetical protein [Nonomuraea sp. B19D2]|uniref:hypothetical protein n=1 Tax=Nonomuraea sp. B19D2 TaxID=3159561 RepID=UPI0032DA9D5C